MTSPDPATGAQRPADLPEQPIAPGTLYGVSLGPGDPELITRRSWTMLQRSDCTWAWPIRRARSASYALGIVERAGLIPPCDGLPLVFPMSHDRSLLARYWLQAAQQVQTVLRTGRSVCFLVEGDASTYATFGHLARTLQAIDPDIPVSTLPGVASYHAAAARVGMPLADPDDAIAIIPAAYGLDTIARHLDDFDTLVLLKVKPLLEPILALLAERNLLAHTRFIEKAGAPEERIVTDVASLAGSTVNYLSLLLVRQPDRPKGELVRGCRARNAA